MNMPTLARTEPNYIDVHDARTWWKTLALSVTFGLIHARPLLIYMFRSISVYLVVLATLYALQYCLPAIMQVSLSGSGMESLLGWLVSVASIALGIELFVRIGSWMKAYSALRRVPAYEEATTYHRQLRGPFINLFLLNLILAAVLAPIEIVIVFLSVNSPIMSELSWYVLAALNVSVYVVLAMSVPAAVWEGCSGGEAVVRGVTMMKGYAWWTLGMTCSSLALIAFIYVVTSEMYGYIVTLALDLYPADHIGYGTLRLAATTGVLVVVLLAATICFAGMLINYASIRAAKEGRQLPRQVDTIGDPLKPSQEQ